MDFSLSSSLVGSAVLNADKLSLDLQFAADKTLTARKGPTPVFTRASTAAFVGSNGLIQSAAVNTPRFDHDPVTLACKGLLIEESRTNVALYSGAIVNGTGWNTAETTSTASGTGPDGNTAYQISETALSFSHSLINTGTGTVTNGTSTVLSTVYTGSIFLKKVAGNVDWVQLTLGAGGFGTSQYANFNLSTGAYGSFAGLTAGTVPRIEAFPNGWYRCSITVTAIATTATSAGVLFAFTNNTNTTTRALSYTGSTSNSVLASLCQFETGSFATSYIPTVASSVVRSADVCSITGSDFTGIYNQPEGTLFADVIPQAVDQSAFVFGVNASTSALSHIIYKTNSSVTASGKRWGAATVSAAGAQTAITTTTDVAVSRSRLAYAYKLNDFAFAASGSLVGTDTSGTLPSPFAMRIGARDDGLAINGHLASIRYFRKRLPNEKLQALTV